MTSVYQRFGVPTVINACGTVTRLSGGRMHPEVAAAMAAASSECVDMIDLQAGACRVIARITGAQAAIVTSGASAGVLLGAAACLAGLDPARMNRLPEVSRWAQRIHRRAQSAQHVRPRHCGRRRPHRRGRHSRPLLRTRRARRDRMGDRGRDHAGHRRDLLSRASAIAAAACGGRCRGARAWPPAAGRCRGATAAGGQSAALPRSGRRSGRVQRRQGDRRAAGFGDPVRSRAI